MTQSYELESRDDELNQGSRAGSGPQSKSGRFNWAIAASMILSLAGAGTANALEGATPFLPGVSIGLPVGAAPPAGWYFNSAMTFFDNQVKNNSNQNVTTGAKSRAVISSNSLLWVPDIPLVLGATYSTFVIQGVAAKNSTNPAGSFSDFGPTNTLVSPLNLSWNLHNGLFVSFGVIAYVPDSIYKPTDIVQVGRNYWTIEPGVGISYLANGFDLTLHPAIDFNSLNQFNDYQSGIVMVTDYTATYTFQKKFELGLGGTYTQQLTYDTQFKQVIAANVNRGYGNKVMNFTLGPIAGYDLGFGKFQAWFTKSLYAQNGPAGNNYWARLVIPLFTNPPAIIAKY